MSAQRFLVAQVEAVNADAGSVTSVPRRDEPVPSQT